ncbi:MAG: diguanylate cyclase domain-containing protein [Pseudomonadota bacterium]
MSLDLLTLSITLTFAAILSALALSILWRIDRHLAGVFQWMLGSLFIGLAFLTIFLVGMAGHSGALDAFISNALSMPAVLLVLEGCLRFRGHPPSAVRGLAALVLIPVMIIMAWLLRDDAQSRYLLHDAVATLGLGAAGVVMIWRTRTSVELRAYLLAASSAFMLAAAFAVRWMVAASAEDAAAVALDMPVSLALYLALILFSIGWTYGVAIACYYRSNQYVMQLAREDALTGLPNRRRIDEELGRARKEAERSGRGFAVIMMDVDAFKSANDRFGHAAGDELLKTIAGRLKDFVRDADFAGRMGGDEFIIIARDVADVGEGEMIRRRLARSVQGAVELSGGHRFDVTISAGVALWGVDGESVEELITAADRRMYRDKPGHVHRTR